MQKSLEKLRSMLAEISDLQNIGELLNWDQQTYMPRGAAEGRGYQLGTIRSLTHTKFTSSEIGKLLDELEPYAKEIDPDSDDARLIKVTRVEFDKATRVPPEFVAEMAHATTVSNQVWVEARSENDFSKFQPYLEKIFDLRRRYADFFVPYDHIYDPLLDDFERGLKTKEVVDIFEKLRLQQVALVKAIAEKPAPDTSFLHKNYDEQMQWDFGVQVISQFGYDWNHGRQDRSAHPFTQSIGLQDIRITTRTSPGYLNTGLFGTMHECGHALYDMGIDPSLDRSTLASGTSLGVHESQSRMWENIVGRSLPFWEHFFPKLQQVFPSQLNDVSLEQFYRGVNSVQPSFIRIEADEVTYNLHIMLRLELEIAVLEGKLEIKDLPLAWNERMDDYLGIVPHDDAEGVLQDVHWSVGLVGYFPTYALGNLISAQLWDCIIQEIPDLNKYIRTGDFSELLGWLRKNIHRHGAKFEPQELVQRVTGNRIDPAPYLKYLQTKFGQIYGI
jgi:carboxypeptidase Taq